MHAVVASATIHEFDRARKGLDEMVPTISQAPGFVAGYWTRSEDNRGLSMIVFESEDAARNVAERLRSEGPPDPEAVTIDNVEVREVVANA
jgi:heme-degrading monooxygenase HmoA